MARDSDVRLAFGFHCVVNRSQKNIDEGMSREDLWKKEEQVFTRSDRLRRLPLSNWGTLRLMEKVAKIQEARVDESWKPCGTFFPVFGTRFPQKAPNP